MEIIELGQSQLTLEKFYGILYLNQKVILDPSVGPRFSTGPSLTFTKTETSVTTRAQTITLLSMLLNTDNSTSIDSLNQLTDILNNNSSVQPFADQPITQISNTLLLSVPASLLVTLSELALALFCELQCAHCGDVMNSANYTVRRHCLGLKQSAENIRLLLSGSKKINQKKVSLQIGCMVQDIGLLQDYAYQFRQFARADIMSGAFLGEDQKPTIQYQFDSSLLVGQLQKIYQQSVYRVNMLKLFEHKDGIWRGFELKELLIQDEQIDIEKLVQQVVTELDISYKLLQSAAQSLKKGKVQVGQGILQFLDLDYHFSDNCFQNAFSLENVVKQQIYGAIQSRRVPQPPTGTRDLHPNQTFIREKALEKIKNIFTKHGAVSVETPVFESREVLLGKYGEQQKLIYHLQDFGEEPLALRYDLTVPFSRYCATYKVKQLKRYCIGRVYRRDKPVMEKGRFREFYQCDFDIAADHMSASEMVPDAEVLCVIFEILHQLDIGEFKILLNHRALLEAILQVSGVTADKFKGVCACVDELDKETREEVKRRIVQTKGVSEQSADTIMELVQLNDNAENISSFIDKIASQQPALFKLIETPLKQLQLLIQYLKLMCPEAVNKISIDFSLARGLDYYTGMVFEAKLIINGEMSGSIAGGGRYDKLLGAFRGDSDLPAVGGSVGIERLFAILEGQNTNMSTQGKEYDVFVCSAPGSLLDVRLTIAGRLWKHGIKVGLTHRESGSMKSLKTDLEEASSSGAILALIVGGDELARNSVALKNMVTQEQVEISLDDLETRVLERLGSYKKEFALQVAIQLVENIVGGNIDQDSIVKKLEELKKLI